MAPKAPTPRRGLAVAALAVAVLAAVAAAAARPAGASPPPLAAIRQADDAPDTVLPMADLLAKHCNGTAITDDTQAARNTTAAWTGSCTLVLAVPGGELTWGAGSAAAIDGALVIRLADGAPPAPPPGGEESDDGEVEWEAGAVLRATSLTVTVRDIEVGAGAALATTDAGGAALSAAGDVDIEAGAAVGAAAGPVAIAATGDVDVGAAAAVAAGDGAVTITAGGDVDLLPGSTVAGAGNVTVRAAAAATLNNMTLTSGGVLTVTAPSCTAEGVTADASTAQVCE